MHDYLVREVSVQDLPGLVRWLPKGADVSVPSGTAGEWWLAAVEPDGDVPVATLRVRTALGMDRPRYWYRVGCMVHAAADLGRFNHHRTLLLGNDYTGAAELADLAADPLRLDTEQARQAQVMLQVVALQRIRGEVEAGRCSGDTIVAELPGLRDAAGRSPFWQGLGRHFHPVDPDEALARSGAAWRTWVAALMPSQCVYVSMLAEQTQRAIGQVGDDSRVFAEALTASGFRPGRHVRIDDGGPVFELRIG